MTQETTLVSPGMQFILATRHLERIADHATTLPRTSSSGSAVSTSATARGLAVRHDDTDPADSFSTGNSVITENSHALHSDVTPGLRD